MWFTFDSIYIFVVLQIYNEYFEFLKFDLDNESTKFDESELFFTTISLFHYTNWKTIYLRIYLKICLFNFPAVRYKYIVFLVNFSRIYNPVSLPTLWKIGFNILNCLNCELRILWFVVVKWISIFFFVSSDTCLALIHRFLPSKGLGEKPINRGN